MPDSILALHVRRNDLRVKDHVSLDAEAQAPEASAELMISAVDDSENVCVFFFNELTTTSNVRNLNIKKVKQSEAQATISLRDKHFFGMGYPYFICGYGNHVAVTTDYGILLFSVEQSNQRIANRNRAHQLQQQH